MDEKATQRLMQIHTEAFQRYLGMERAVRIAKAAGDDSPKRRARRDRLRERSAALALVLLSNSRRNWSPNS